MKHLRCLLLAAASLSLVSCLEMKSTVTVNKDGSATVEETMLLGAQLAAMMAQQGDGEAGPGGQLKGLVLDKEGAEKRAKELGEGVTVKSIEEMKTPDGKTGNKVTFAVADIRKLKYKPNTPDKKDGAEEKAGDEMTFALEGGTLTITNPDADKKKEGAEKPKRSPEEIEQMKAQMGMMKQMFAGMRMTVEVKAAGGIASSDASHQTADTVTYLDIQFDKLMENADAFATMMEGSDDMSMADAAKKFEKVEGMKIEGRKVVKMELK